MNVKRVVAIGVAVVLSALSGWGVDSAQGADLRSVEALVEAYELSPGFRELDDQALARVAGRGVPQAGPNLVTADVVLWDERPTRSPAVHSHSSTGIGATQSSTLSVNGR